jgi:hypothetical protein
MDGPLTVKVECYSGSEYANRPTAIFYNGKRQAISRVLTEEYTPDGKRFQVVLEDGRPLVLEYCELTDTWMYTGSL